MVAFDKVLADIEDRGDEPFARSARAPCFLASLQFSISPATGRASARASTYADAYALIGAAAAPPRTESVAPSVPDRNALLEELRLASGCLPRLRALRRRFALQCHPDRARLPEDRAQGLMAELNARLDAEIARSLSASSVKSTG
jgi:hypothetical protein